jgi:HSP20 family protein
VVRDPITELLFEDRTSRRSGSVWRPAADVYATAEGFLVKLDLAGVRPEDVTVTLAGDALTIAGCRRDWLVQRGWDHLQMEIAYNCFERRILLPCGSGSCRVTTEFRDGLLLVRIDVERP